MNSAVLRTHSFVVIVALHSAYFSNRFVAGHQSIRIEYFSDFFIPLFTVWIHLALVRFLPLWGYRTVAILDVILKAGIATYHDYFDENVDIHILLSNASEGVQVAGYVFDLIPKFYLLIGLAAVILQCWLAGKIVSKIRDRLLIGTTCLVIPLFSYAVYKVPLNRATLVTDYTICIKAHGYYTAMLSDLLFTGSSPSDVEMSAEIEQMQRDKPPVPVPIRITNQNSFDRLLVIQIESLDYNILNFHHDGKAVTPFLNRLQQAAVMMKLNSYHYGASGSSGADFQFLMGKLPLRNYPVFKVRKIDYRDSLPAKFERRSIDTYAFHGNASSMWSRGMAYKSMGVKRFYDVRDYPATDARWGVSDRLFFQHSSKLIEQHPGANKCFFLITLSSHGPFDYVKHDAFPGRSLTLRYFNSIHYVDRELESFLKTLRGTYFVIVYGDHASGIDGEGYESKENGKEFVPGFVFILENGSFRKPEIEGDTSNLTNGQLDIRSLKEFAISSYP